MKKRIKGFISRVAHWMARCELLPRLIIIRMDGGICSQMHFFLVGTVLEREGNKVIYDTSWYEKDGKDLDGKHSRNYELTKLFPKLEVGQLVNPLLRRIYISCFYKHNDYFQIGPEATRWMRERAPLYLGGYFQDTDRMYTDLFPKLFNEATPELDDWNKSVVKEITGYEQEGYEICGIHVRRGDLSKFNTAYGEPVDKAYFKNAVSQLKERVKGKFKFYIFSDDPEWCMTNIIPQEAKEDYRMCDHNGSDRGHLDLYLLSRCCHIICSQGSIGKYAALLREPRHRHGEVYLPPNENSVEWLRRFENAHRLTQL